MKVIVHIDMDMFYAAVEMRDQPHLKEKPMAVGTKAMLTTSNYKVFPNICMLICECKFNPLPTTRPANLESDLQCPVSSPRSSAHI